MSGMNRYEISKKFYDNPNIIYIDPKGESISCKNNIKQSEWQKNWEENGLCNTCTNNCYDKDIIIKACSNYREIQGE